jgi:hypothetical protein
MTLFTANYKLQPVAVINNVVSPLSQSMVCSQVANERLQIWTVAANILNMQLQTANKDCPPAWGLGGRLILPHHKETSML